MSNILRQRLEARQSVHTEHPGTDLLAAFVEHRLKDSEREKLLGHLATCSACRDAIILAIPEAAAETAGTAAARGFSGHFPAAMRWASVAAALAVAVGVGVLSYEHETVSTSTKIAAMPSSSAEQTKPATAESEQAKTPPEQQNAPSSRENTADRNKYVSPNAGSVNGLLASAGSSARGSRVGKFENSSRTFAKKLREQPVEVSGQNQAIQPAEAYLDVAPTKPVNAVSQNDIAETRAVVAAAPPPPPSAALTAPTGQEGQVAFADGRVPVETKNRPLSVKGALEAGGPGSVHEESLNMPPKAAGFSALPGTMMRKSEFAFTEMVSWTVTAAGKLQRQLHNGAVKFIEPAPGVMVRAVAARGIEVWAAGLQPDLSARQWRQAPALFHSSDAGETWTKVNGPWHSSINTLTLTSSSSLTVATEDGTWVSRDAGKSWTTE